MNYSMNRYLTITALLLLTSCSPKGQQDLPEIANEDANSQNTSHSNNRSNSYGSQNKLLNVDVSKYAANPALYYGMDLNNPVKSLTEKEILSHLERVLNLAHIQGSNDEADKISDKCSPEQNCYKHRIYRYRQARKYLFGLLHLEKLSGKDAVQDIYCGDIYLDGDKVSGQRINLGVDTIPTANVINTEHSWPKARFDNLHGRTQTREHTYDAKLTDLHHLYPTDSEVNRERATYHFAEVSKITKPLKCANVKLGTVDGLKGKYKSYVYFEPPTPYKGNIARGLMYMSVKYEMPINDIEEKFLRKWHNEDPVDSDEIIRNNRIHQVQGVRNPFIDFPSLESQISNF